jgi:hypothetical protein
VSYAKNTTVSEEKSRVEIETIIRKHAGREAAFSYGTGAGRAAIQFSAHGRNVRFELPLPTREEAMEKVRDGRAPNRPPTSAQIEVWIDDECRRRWRCLLLIVKAKFEAVELRMELASSSEEAAQAFDQEFLACIVGDSGQTVYQAIHGAKVGTLKLLPSLDER